MSPQPYRIHMSALVRDQLVAVLLEADERGFGPRARAEALALERALTWTPEIVAEPVYDLPTLGRVQVGSFGPIQLKIAVNDSRREVYVSWFRLEPQSSS
jgi:hypothetical protein